MLIKKLTLHNFRQYVGTQEIEFSVDKERNVTVLIGVNTSGKTTLLGLIEITNIDTDFKMMTRAGTLAADTLQPGFMGSDLLGLFRIISEQITVFSDGVNLFQLIEHFEFFHQNTSYY